MEPRQSLEFQLVSPDGKLFSNQVDMVVIPGDEGDLGVMARHAPMVVALKPGIIDIYETQGEIAERIFVAGGFANIHEGGCTVMADEGIPVNDIDPQELESFIEQSLAKLEKVADQADKAQIESEISVARAKIEMMKRLLKH